MKEKVFLDTSAIFALINSKDPDHPEVSAFVDSFKGKMVITNYIFDEIITLVLSRLGHKQAVNVGDILRNSPQVENLQISPNDEKSAWKFFKSREDKGYSFTDCTSFIVMERSKIRKYLALDEHFRQEGFEGVL